MTSISAGHIILTPTQPVGSGRPQRGSNPGPPDQESRALPTELPRPLAETVIQIKRLYYNVIQFNFKDFSNINKNSFTHISASLTSCFKSRGTISAKVNARRKGK